MPVAITPALEEKIARRARRAWRAHRRGEDRQFTRISEVTERTLKYRLPDGPPHSDGWYGKTKVLVRREKGEVVIETPPRDPMIVMLSKWDLDKLDNHGGRVRAFKYTTKEGKSPTRTGSEQLTYKVGDIISVKNADTSKSKDCSYGINLASQDWIKKHAYGDARVFACEFEIEDLAAVPNGTDGKFRVFKCAVVEELDPTSFGPLVIPPKPVKPLSPPPSPGDDPLARDPADRQAERRKKLAERRKAQAKQKMLPAVIDKPEQKALPPERQLPPPEKAEKPGRPGWLERIWKRLGL